MFKRLNRQLAASLVVYFATAAKLSDHSGVISRVTHYRNAREVFSSSANQCDTADVDLFNGLFKRDTGLRYRFLERVEVADNQPNRSVALGLQFLHVCVRVAGQ